MTTLMVMPMIRLIRLMAEFTPFLVMFLIDVLINILNMVESFGPFIPDQKAIAIPENVSVCFSVEYSAYENSASTKMFRPETAIVPNGNTLFQCCHI